MRVFLYLLFQTGVWPFEHGRRRPRLVDISAAVIDADPDLMTIQPALFEEKYQGVGPPPSERIQDARVVLDYCIGKRASLST